MFRNRFASLIWTVLLWSIATNAAADWLSDQRQQNGSITTVTDLATATQSTAEAVRTLRMLGRASEATAAEGFVAAESYGGIEYLSRRLIAVVDAGGAATTIIAELQSRQNLDGGFGEFAAYESNAADTALAVEALAIAGQVNSTAAGQGIGYLLQKQRSDGAWPNSSGESDVFATALAMRSLHYYRSRFAAIPSVLGNAGNFLLSRRSSDGSWGEPLLTSQSLLALSLGLSDLSPLVATRSSLIAARSGNGSWLSDVYTTALAMRALFVFDARHAGGALSSSGGVVTGYVFRGGSSEPLSGATARLSSSSTGVLTNSDGYFVLNGAPVGDQTILVTKSGFGSASVVASVRSGQYTSAGDIYLPQDADQTLVSGTVSDSTTGLPLGGVEVRLTGAASISVISSVNGAFDFGALPPGSYQIAYNRSGYNGVTGTLVAPTGSVTSLRQGMLREGAFADASPGVLTGQVVDALTDAPIASANLSVGSVNVLTDAEGRFIVPDVVRGDHQMMVTAGGYALASVSFVFPPGASGQLGAIALYPAVGLPTPSTLTLVGTVVGAIDNRPLANASVQVDGGSSVSTDAFGKFRLEGLASLAFTVTVAAAEHETRSFVGTASAFGEVAGTFALPPLGGSPTATTTSLSGQVIDNVTQAPIEGVRVDVSGTTISAVTAADGSFTLNGIAPLSFSLQASAVGYTVSPYSIQLTQHGNYNIEIGLNADPNSAAALFQVLTVNPVVTGTGANSQQMFAARVSNIVGDSQAVVVVAQAFDAAGVMVARFSPVAVGTDTPTSEFTFDPNETKDLRLPWSTAQLPPGTYRIVVQVVQEGTISRDLPSGVVLAEGETSANIVATQLVAGQTSFDPPLTQAGATVPVSLTAIARNDGNVPLMGESFTLTISDPTANNVVHTAQATIAMLEVANSVALDFGTWVPIVAGNLNVSIRPTASVTVGSISGSLYVGDKATGTFAVNRSTVPLGTQTVRASVSLQGVDARTGTSTDPLFFAVREAIRRGGMYVAPQVRQWNDTGRCLGCHIQTQSIMGLASAMDKADIDRDTVRYLYNDLAGALQSGGQILVSHANFYPKNQTSLAIWALSNWHDERQVFRTLYRGSNYQMSRRSTSGNQTWWTQDHASAWLSSAEGATMTTVKGLAATLRMAAEIGSDAVPDFIFEDTGVSFGLANMMGGQQSSDGQIYYVNDAGNLYARDLQSGSARTIATGLGTTQSPAVGVAVRNDGIVYVSSGTGLHKVMPNGTRSLLRPAGPHRWDATMGPDGAVYAVEGTGIVRVDANDQASVYVSSGLFNLATGLVFDDDGNLYVANSGGYNILRVAPDRTVSVFADGLPFRPTWLRRAADGFLYSVSVDHTSDGYSPPGVFRIRGDGYVERLPLFNAPNRFGYNALLVIDGDIHVSHASNHRMYRLRTINQDTSGLSAMQSALVGAARYTVARYNDNNTRNDIHAMRLITLAEARPYISDSALLAQIDAAIANIATLLRNRQRPDGGWVYVTGRTVSDPYTTAHVGMALDHTNPSVDDPMVRRSITYLLNSQAADNSWPYVNGPFETRLGPASFVMAYLPLALDRLGGIDADLRISIPANNQLSNPNIAPITQVPNADGGIDYLWSMQGVTARSREVQFDLTLTSMTFNETRPAASAAYIEFDNSFSGEVLRTDISIPNIQASRDASLAVVTDRPSYPAHTDAAITSTVTNIGPPISSGTVHLIVRASDNSVAADLGNFPVGPLATNASIVIPAAWNTGAYLAGPYQVNGRLFAGTGEQLFEASAAFEIVTGNAVVGATIAPDKPIYRAWDAVTLTSRIRNLATNAIQPNSLAEVTVRTPTGQTLFQSTYGVGELSPAAIRDVASALNLVDAISGEYPVGLVVRDLFSRNVVATAASSFRVQREEIQSLTGSVAVSATQIHQGQTNLCTDTVSNQSASALAGAVLTRQLVGLDSEQVISSEQVSVDFAGGQSNVLFRSIQTRDLPLGGYACALSATVNGATHQLGQAGFQVIPAPVRVESALTMGSHGRVLILVDASPDPKNAPDPFGPLDAPDLVTQRWHLHSVLKAHGWSYDIVDTASKFGQLFENGVYEVYAILSERVKLPESLQDKLVAAVHAGKGLVVAGNHDNRNGRLDAALGIQSLGKNLNVEALDIVDSDLMSSINEAFVVISPPNAIRLDGATAAGYYRIANPLPNQGLQPAVTINRYGQGKSVYAGFDLPLAGAAAGDDSLFGQLFIKSLEFAHAEVLTPYSKRVVPLKLELFNLGVATSGQAIVALPPGAYVSDPGSGIAPANNLIVWSFSLAAGGSTSLPFWVALPKVPGPIAIDAFVRVGVEGNYQDHDTSSIVINVEARP